MTIKYDIDVIVSHKNLVHFPRKPVIQEMKVWSKEWGIAGTLDGLFELSNKYYVGDYKTNKDLLTAIINRDIYIETLSTINKDISNNLLRKKNLPVKCINNKNIIELINDT